MRENEKVRKRKEGGGKEVEQRERGEKTERDFLANPSQATHYMQVFRKLLELFQSHF